MNSTLQMVEAVVLQQRWKVWHFLLIELYCPSKVIDELVCPILNPVHVERKWVQEEVWQE